MSQQSLAVLYNTAFSHLETAKVNEGKKDDNNMKALQEYRSAIGVLETIVQIETDNNKKNLVFNNIKIYQQKVNELSQRRDLVVEQSEVMKSLISKSNSSISNNINNSSSKANNTNATRPQSKADVDFVAAIALDEQRQSSTTFSTSNTAILHQCIDLYMSAAEGYLKESSMKDRVILILDRVEILKGVKNNIKSSSSSSCSGTSKSTSTSSSSLSSSSSSSLQVPSSTQPIPSSTPTTTVDSLFSALPDVSKFSVPVGAGDTTNSIKPTTTTTSTSINNNNGNVAGAKTSNKPSSTNLVATAGTNANNNNNISNSVADGGLGLSEREIQVLKSSSVVNGKIYMPWLPGEEERERFRFDHVYCDPDGLLTLSPSQIAAGAVWKRPSEFISGLSAASEAVAISAATTSANTNTAAGSTDITGGAGNNNVTNNDTTTSSTSVVNPVATVPAPTTVKPVMIHSVDALNIQQHLVSDCSFVCSLCIAAALESKFKKKLITSIIYPQNSNRVPVYNAYGKYLVKLIINGVPRKVIVDDRLPVHPLTNQLVCSSSSQFNELWVSIIEKAYMKINGGYDFPGSNSGVDLFALTGWIPEHVYFNEKNGGGDNKAATTASAPVAQDENDFTQSGDRAWKRIKSAHAYGDCLVTVGTGALTTEEEKLTGLVPCHAYAVLDVKEAGILRILKVKNPWNTRPWLGAFSYQDRARWTVGLMKALGIKNEKEFNNMSKQGVFWIEFKDCRKYFPGYYLNWNPNLFSFRTVTHDCWPLSQGPLNDTYFIGDNPQFCLIVDCRRSGNTSSGGSPSAGVSTSTLGATQTIWVLLSRHVNERKSKTAENQTSAADDVGKDYLALHVHKLQAPRRLYSGSTAKAIQGVYSDGTHTLVRIDADQYPNNNADNINTNNNKNYNNINNNINNADDDTEQPLDLGDSGEGTATQSFLSSISNDLLSTDKGFALVLSQRHRTAQQVNYTVHVYGTVPFKFYPSPSPPPHKVELVGMWTNTCCGMKAYPVSFARIPQYRLFIPDTNNTKLSLSSMHIHIQSLYPKTVNAKIYVYRSGERINANGTTNNTAYNNNSASNNNTNNSTYNNTNTNSPPSSASAPSPVVTSSPPPLPPLKVMTSGKCYKAGYCGCDGLLQPGVYTVILSTFEADITLERFRFSVAGSADTFRVAEIL